jgi:hypothetical protein
MLAMVAASGPAVLGLATVAMLLMAAGGRHPMWRVRDFNLSEAAGSRDAATVVSLLSSGEDSTRARLIRPGVLDTRWHRLTPLEAAFESRRVDMIDLLLRHGVTLDEPGRVALTCRARARGDGDIARYLETRGAPVSCGSKPAHQ